MNPSDHRIALVLCDASEKILWSHISAWANRRYPGVQFITRVGTGKSTYCKFTKLKRQFSITYGRKMILSQLESRSKAANWTNGKEILERNYFHGELSAINAMTSVVCHEFAHVVQGINGWRYIGSVHNNQFYRILDRIHASGQGDAVKQYISARVGDIQYRQQTKCKAEQSSHYRYGAQVFNTSG